MDRLVKAALDRSLEDVKAGAAGSAVFERVCDVFHEAGYPTQLSKQEGEVLDRGFYHGLGHGVGLEVHEPPWLSRDPGTVEAGDVVPRSSRGSTSRTSAAVASRAFVLVTEDGNENLTQYPYDLTP